jgi:hypothetical protein
MCRSRMRLVGASFMLACMAAFAVFPTVAWASGRPARTEILTAGPYIIDVNLYQDPPVTDQPVEVTVIPHEVGLRLFGRILMVPGVGTNAVELYSMLLPLDRTTTLVGRLRMPVREPGRL